MTTPGDPLPLRVLVAAIGGYGHHYLQALLDEVPAQHAELAGIVDPHARLAAARTLVYSRQGSLAVRR